MQEYAVVGAVECTRPTDSLVRLLRRDPVSVGSESSGCQRTLNAAGRERRYTCPCTYVVDIMDHGGRLPELGVPFVRKGRGGCSQVFTARLLGDHE